MSLFVVVQGAFSRLDPNDRFSNIAKARIPAGRLGEIAELSNLACYLVSDYSSWMTGSVSDSPLSRLFHSSTATFLENLEMSGNFDSSLEKNYMRENCPLPASNLSVFNGLFQLFVVILKVVFSLLGH